MKKIFYTLLTVAALILVQHPPVRAAGWQQYSANITGVGIEPGGNIIIDTDADDVCDCTCGAFVVPATASERKEVYAGAIWAKTTGRSVLLYVNTDEGCIGPGQGHPTYGIMVW